jgi:hypothetical protein
MYRIIAILLLPFVLNGCAAVLVGGLIYHDSKTRDQRLAFTQDFQKQNIEREKAGLKPMDWCSELYKFDQSWYAEDANCKAAADKTKATDKPATADKSETTDSVKS